ncbi:MAG: proprotein convertase P-domain-containing protein [Chitinophagales bacterium]|nr:proprotein convertase P-domain-containing protein [Chitinophagales bacterium]
MQFFSKNHSSVVKTCLFVALFLATNLVANAQTYSSACGINANIPDISCGNFPLTFNIPVSGANGTQLGNDIVVASVSIIIAHTFDGDLNIQLVSPNNVVVGLASGLGSSGNNYGNPLDVTCTSVTHFSRTGANGDITAGAPPFIGNFIPRESLDLVNDGSDPNGNWKLVVCDGFGGDVGALKFVQLEFLPPCEMPGINGISTTSNSATVGWTSANDGATYTLEYGVPGFTPGNIGSLGIESGIVVAGNNVETIAGLSPFANYDFYLSEDCGLLLSDTSGAFSFTTNKVNDICADAIAIACGETITDATSAGTSTAGAPAACGVSQSDAPGLWYVFAGNGMDVTVSTCGLNGYDTRLGVFEGPCLDLTCVEGNEDFCGIQSEVTFNSALDKDYYLYVSGNTAATGLFQLDVTCSSNLIINEIDYAQTGVDSAEFIEIKNTGSTTVSLAAVKLLLVDGSGGGAVIYDTIDLPNVNLAAGDYFVVCGSNSTVANCDYELAAAEWLRDGSPDAVAISIAGNVIDAVSYNGDAGALFTETSGVGLEDDSTVSGMGISRIPDGGDSDINNVDFSQRCISPGVSNISQNTACTVSNDSCSSALIIVPALDIPFDNNGATTDGANDALCFFGGSDQIYSDLWYSFTPDCDGSATFTTVGGTAYDTRIAVYLNSCAGVILACNDDSSLLITQSTITWAVTSGITYILRLGGFSSSQQDVGTFDLTLVEAVAPIITCGADKFKTTDPGVCNAVANPLPTTASDNCSAVTLVNDFNLTNNALDTYPLGNTAIVWTATDENGNTATCVQNVTITDIENPSITCPPNYAQTTDAGVCDALVAVATPTTSDNCTVATVVNDFNGTAFGTDTYPIGLTTVVWIVTDNSSNTATCSHTITITDEENPIVTCPPNIVIPSCGNFATVPVPTNSDNCSVASLLNDFNGTGDATGTYPVGVTTVEWTVADSVGNTATCTMTVTRNTPPAASITPDPAETCALTDLILFGNPTLGTSGIASQAWTGPVVGATNLDSVTVNFGLAGVYGPVTYTVTDSNGCSATDNISVTVFANPVATVIPDVLEACAGETVSLAGNFSGGTGPYTHEWTGDTSSLNVANIPNPEFTTAFTGNYSLTYNVKDANGCSGSDTILIIVNENPSVSITPNPAQVCLNTPLTLDANLAAGSGALISQAWTGSTSKISSLINPVVNFNTTAAGIFNLTYSVTDDNLCSATDNITVTVDTLPVVSFAALQVAYCEDAAPDSLIGTPAGGSFSGPGVGGLPVTSDYIGAPDITSVGLNIATQAVSVPGSVLGVDVVLTKVCFKYNHPYVSDIDILLESPSGAQELLVNSICGDGDDFDVCIERGLANSIDLASCNPIAPALSGVFTASVGEDIDSLNDGSTNPNGNWKLLIVDNFANDDGALVSWSLEFEYLGVEVFNPATAGPGNHTITYTFTDGNGCSGTASQNITVNPTPSADAGVNQTICAGDTTMLTASGGTSYSWSTGETTASITITPAADATYFVSVTNASGCSDDDSVTVFVNAVPTVLFSGLAANYCLNENADTLAGTPTGGAFFGAGIISSGGGNTITNYAGDTIFIPSDTTSAAFDTVSGIIGSVLGVDVFLESVCFRIEHTFLQDIVVELVSPGGLSVVLTTQPCGDFDDIDACIETGAGNSMDNAVCSVVSPALSGTFTASSSAGDDLDFINDGVTNPNGVWTLLVADLATGDEGNIIDFSLNFNSVGITTFNPATAGAGVHTIYYAFTNSNGCTGVDSAITTVLAAPPALALPDTGICAGGSVTLTATGGTLYAWSTGSTLDTTTVSPIADSTYTVSVTDGNGCSGTDDVTVIVFATPVTDAGNDVVVCSNSPTILTATGGITYQWSTGDTLASIFIIPTSLAAYSVTGTDANGCTATDTIEVDINTLPLASPGPDEDICFGDTVIITATGGNFYYWSNGTVTSISGAHPVSPLATTVYTVTVEDGNGCTDTASLTVTVHALPDAEISGLNATYCNNDNPITLTGTPAGGNFAGAGMSGDVFLPALLAPGDYEIAYIYIDSFGCTDSDTADVTIMDAPAISFSGLAAAYCPDTVAHVLTGIPAGGVFSGAGISGSSSTFVSAYAGTGTHDIIYTYFAVAVCPGRDTQSVVVYELPQARILDIDSIYCSADEPDTLTGFPAGGIFSGSVMVGDVFFPPAVVTGTPAVVHYEYVDSNGCMDIATKVTTVYPNPSPIIVNPGDLCVNEGIVLLTGAPSGGVFTGAGVTSNALFTNVAGAGTHPIQYTFTDVHGCAGDTSITVTVHDVSAVSFTGLKNEYCVNEPVALLTGAPSGGTYSGFGVGGNTFNPAGAGTGGPYDVVYAYADSNNCTVRDTQSTSVLNSPFAQIGGLNSLYCVYETDVAINLFPAGGELTGPGLSGNNFSPNAAGVGTHIISYKVTNAEGCSEIAIAIVTVDACVGIGQFAALASVNIYPNPSSGQFIVEINGRIEAQTLVRIYDLTGKTVYEERIPDALQNYRREFDLTKLAKGVYFLRINFNSWVAVEKIVTE